MKTTTSAKSFSDTHIHAKNALIVLNSKYASLATNPNNDVKQLPHEYSQQLSWHFLPSEHTPWKEHYLMILRCRNNLSRSFNCF